MYFEYTVILIVGSTLMLLLNTFQSIKEMRKSFTQNKIFFWFTVIIAMMLFLPFAESDSFEKGSNLGFSRIFRLFGFGMIFLQVMFYLLKQKIFPRRSILYLFFIYVLICFLSAFYSPNWIETIWKSIELAILILVVLVLKKELKLRKLYVYDIFNSITYLLIIAVLFSIIGFILFPDIALRTMDDFEGDVSTKSVWGIFPSINPNSFGQFSAMLGLVGMYYIIRERRINKINIILIFIGLIGLFLAYSRTSILAFLLISLFLILKNKNFETKILTFFSIPIFFIFKYNFLEFISRGQNLDQLSSLSGRTYMWQIAWASIVKNPLLGTGFYAGHKSLEIEIGMAYSSLDNTYLEALVDVGAIGTFFLVVFISKIILKYHSLRKLIQLNNSLWLLFGFLLIMIIRSFSGPAFQVFHVNLYFLLLIAISIEFELKNYTNNGFFTH